MNVRWSCIGQLCSTLLLVPIACLLIYLFFCINNHNIWEYDSVFLSLLILIILFTIFYICQTSNFISGIIFMFEILTGIYLNILLLYYHLFVSIWILNMQLSILFMIAFIVVSKFLFDYSCHLRNETLRYLFSFKVVNIDLLVWTHWCYSFLFFSYAC